MRLRTSSTDTEPIAIVGCACRLPGAPDLGSFWELLRRGRSGITDVARHRRPHAPGVARAGLLDEVDRFDADFFGISPDEAAAMDPQQRLLLELVWEAMEDAAIVPAALRGTDCGVFVGVMADDYAMLALQQGVASIGRHTLAGLSRSFIANRISHLFGLRGPSLVVDTGQSSSAVAIHLACESIRNAECATAVVGGVNLNLVPESTLRAERLGALSPDGRCFTFDARANGYVRGEGGAVLVLKPLAQALADADPVYCVVRGSAVNNDGDAPALTQPSRRAQEEVLRLACSRAAVSQEQIQYVELHGTGTKVGDPIEAAALGAVHGTAHRPGSPLLVGSVKTNIGHLEGAAGIVSVLKVALSIRHREIPPSLNFERPHPEIPLERLNLRVQVTGGGWPDPGAPLLAGVSSFGLGGTNCHLVLGEAPPAGAVEETVCGDRIETALAWALSANSPAALCAQAARLADELAARPGTNPADVGFSLASTRSEFAHRAVVIARDLFGFRDGLARLAKGVPAANTYVGQAETASRTAFVFAGHGAPSPGMAADLLQVAPVFRAQVQECSDCLAAHLGWSPMDVLRGTDGAPALNRPEVAQPVLFAVMVGLAGLWRSIGVRPNAVVGQSQGEIAAAYVAGALSLADACALVALHRGIGGGLSGAGGTATIARAAETAPAQLAAALSGQRPPAGDTAFYSAVTGGRLSATELGVDYWHRSLHQAGQFDRAVHTVREDGHSVFIEIGPDPAGPARQGDGGWDSFLASAAAAYVRGAPVTWASLHRGRRVGLPTYPFQRQRYWLDNVSDVDDSPGRDAELAARLTELTGHDQVRLVHAVVRAGVAEILGHRTPDSVDPTRTFRDLGCDSMAALELRDRMDAATGLRLPASLAFDYPTPSLLADQLHSMLSQAQASAALERMEQAVAGLSAEDDSRGQIATRLRDLLRRLDGSDEPHHGSFGLPAN